MFRCFFACVALIIGGHGHRVKRSRCAILTFVLMRGNRAFARLMLVVLVAGVAGVGVVLARTAADAAATSDTAVIESYTLLATQAKLLVGAYSRFQWHHPGPLYFYLLAPFYLAAGGKTAGLNAGAFVIAFGSMALIAAVLLRRSPRLVVIVCAGLALFAWRAAEATASPWNPHVAVLPTAAIVIVAADVVAGAFGMLPLVALLASIAGQAHVALMPCVLAIGTIAAARVLLASPAGQSSAARARLALAMTGVVLAVSWALPVYEQFIGRPRGNLTELWQFFVVQSRSGQTFSVATSAWADMLVGIVRPDFYPAHGWPFVESPVRWAEALSLVAIAGVVLQAWRAVARGRPFDGALSALLLVSAGIALWSATRIDDRIFDHDLFWVSGIGLLILSVLAEVVLSFVFEWQPRPAAAAAAAAACLVVAAAGSAGYLRGIVRQSYQPPADARIARQLADDLTAYLAREGVRRPLIKIDQDAWGVAAGAILALQKEGRSTAVEEDWVVMFTPVFRADASEDAVITVAAPPEHLRLRDRGVPEISSHQPIYAHAERVSGR